jgi:hypothetical protein
MVNNVTTYHYDNARTGWNPNEVVLTTKNVGGLGVLFTYGPDVLDDVINAQPLYLQGVMIAGEILNVVYVATRSATVYAFDADNFRNSRQPWLWKRSLVSAGETGASDGALRATPVIDTAPITTVVQAVMYAVGKFQDDSGNQYFRLHALDVTTGGDVAGVGPARIDRHLVPTVSGSGDPQTAPGSSQVYFDPQMHFNRPALLLANNTVYVAFGSTGDNPPYHGWMISFHKDLKLGGRFCTTPDSTGDDSEGVNTPTLGGAIWQAGFGPAADNDGFIYCITGNGLNTVAAGAKKGSPLDGYETSFDSQQHVNYIGTDGHVHELVYKDDHWGHTDLTVAAGAQHHLPVAGSRLDGYETSFDSQQHVNYIGTDGHVHELVYKDDHWGHTDVTVAAGAQNHLPVAGSPLDGYETSVNNQQHVNYIGIDGHVHELVYKDHWGHTDVTVAAGAQHHLPVAGSPLDGYETSFDSQQHVNYIGTDGHVHELVYKDDHWGHTDLTVAAGAQHHLPVAGSPLDGYETDFNNQQHVNYIGTSGHVHELVYKDHWSHTDLDVATHRNRNYAESLLQLNKNLALSGSFTPPDPLALTLNDTDFGSAGPVVLPDGVGAGKFVVGCGKDANVYLVDRAQMAPQINQIGKFNSTVTLVSHSNNTGDGGGKGVWGGPAYYGGPLSNLIYYCGDSGPLQALAVSGGSLMHTKNQTPPSEKFPNEGGIIPVVTSNGSTPGTGVVWGITRPDPDDDNQLHLRAYDAADLTKGHLFDGIIGSWNPNSSQPGNGAFLAPIIVNGKVYVAADHLLAVYGISG